MAGRNNNRKEKNKCFWRFSVQREEKETKKDPVLLVYMSLTEGAIWMVSKRMWQWNSFLELMRQCRAECESTQCRIRRWMTSLLMLDAPMLYFPYWSPHHQASVQRWSSLWTLTYISSLKRVSRKSSTGNSMIIRTEACIFKWPLRGPQICWWCQL